MTKSLLEKHDTILANIDSRTESLKQKTAEMMTVFIPPAIEQSDLSPMRPFLGMTILLAEIDNFHSVVRKAKPADLVFLIDSMLSIFDHLAKQVRSLQLPPKSGMLNSSR